MNRIVGLETEYGCLSREPTGPAGAVARVRNWIFEKERLGVADMHQRDWDEPAGNGGFLFNGGRAYVDMGHLEYCTPECVDLLDVLRYDRAGDRILVQAVRDLGLEGQVSFVRNNVDHYSGATFGCHENYLVRRTAPLGEVHVLSLLCFLTLRVLYTGAGRVGSSAGAEHRGDASRSAADGQFQMSQRADYINNDLFEWVQFNRAIINTRDEPLADGRLFRRLHLLHGDTSVIPATAMLKVGTTSLMLDLLEAGALPAKALADAVLTFRHLSHQPDGPWRVTMLDGGVADAVELLGLYQETARKELGGRDGETDLLLAIWKETLGALATAPESLVGRIDWITKRWILKRFMEAENLGWHDAWLKSQDLEFHQVDPERSLGAALAQAPGGWELTEGEVERAMTAPPVNTRAALRVKAMRGLSSRRARFFVDWDVLDAEGMAPFQLLNPFESESRDLEGWLERIG